MTSVPEIRKLMRQRRRALNAHQQRIASRKIKKKLHAHPAYVRAQRIAFYLVNDGEIDPMLLMQLAHQEGKQCYLPVLHPRRKGHLCFVLWTPNTKLLSNRFNIPEPPFHDLKAPAWSLGLVCVPLVAFDKVGGRIGMGGGFYDRTFAFTLKTARRGRLRPQLIGLAHACQEVEHIAQRHWDVPLQAIVSA